MRFFRPLLSVDKYRKIIRKILLDIMECRSWGRCVWTDYRVLKTDIIFTFQISILLKHASNVRFWNHKPWKDTMLREHCRTILSLLNITFDKKLKLIFVHGTLLNTRRKLSYVILPARSYFIICTWLNLANIRSGQLFRTIYKDHLTLSIGFEILAFRASIIIFARLFPGIC